MEKTDKHRQTHRTTTATLAAHARQGLTIVISTEVPGSKVKCQLSQDVCASLALQK